MDNLVNDIIHLKWIAIWPKTHANINSLVVVVVDTLCFVMHEDIMSMNAVFDSEFHVSKWKATRKKCALRRRWIEQKREKSPKRQHDDDERERIER